MSETRIKKNKSSRWQFLSFDKLQKGYQLELFKLAEVYSWWLSPLLLECCCLDCSCNNLIPYLRKTYPIISLQLLSETVIIHTKTWLLEWCYSNKCSLYRRVKLDWAEDERHLRKILAVSNLWGSQLRCPYESLHLLNVLVLFFSPSLKLINKIKKINSPMALALGTTMLRTLESRVRIQCSFFSWHYYLLLRSQSAAHSLWSQVATLSRW